MTNKDRLFVKEAIRHKGDLRSFILKVWGDKALDSHERIKYGLLEKIASATCPVCHNRICSCPTPSVVKRAQLALELRTAKISSKAKKRGRRYYYY